MNKNICAVLCLIVMSLACRRASAAQKIISGVPNYDQDVFPIDKVNGEISGSERGDCTPIACTMLNGYWDANGWPHLIPYGSNAQVQNAWGIDTVVRQYKTQLGYVPNDGTSVFPTTKRDRLFANKQGDAIVAVIRYFDLGASFSREDDNVILFWSRIQSYLNNNRPCVLSIAETGSATDATQNTWRWEDNSLMTGLYDGAKQASHTVCAVGWSDARGRWIICNMGWKYTKTGWFNYDSDDEWYISQITPGGTPSGEEDDAYEDNDTIGTARQINPGTINNLRCLDTLIVNGDYKSSYGDWYKVTAAAGQSLTVTTSFTHANGNLDLRVYDPNQNQVGSSEGGGNSESVNVSTTIAGSYYAFVYGNNGAKNQNYSLTVTLSASTTALASSVPVNGLSGATDSQKLFKITVPAGQTRLEFRLSGGTGDCDLFLRFGTPPTLSSYSYSSEENSNNEAITISNPAAGDWYVMLYGYRGYSGATLVASYVDASFRLLAGTGSDGPNQFGLVELQTNPAREVPIISNRNYYFPALDMAPDGRLYGASSSLYLIDPTTGKVTKIGAIRTSGNVSITPNSIAFSPEGILYATDYDSDTSTDYLYTIDTTTAIARRIGPITAGYVWGIDFAPDGRLYGAFSSLYVLDRNTGRILSEIGQLAVTGWLVDIDFASDGFIYGLDNFDQALLYRINPNTAATTAIGVYQSDLWGIVSQPRSIINVVPPSIVTPPASQAVAAGANVNFSVTATGTAPLVYQWRKDGVNLAGATTATYAIVNAQATSHAGKYTVVVSNSGGSVTSAEAVLTITGVSRASKGDLNGDGQPDILFQDANGFLGTWFMNGLNLTSGGFLQPNNVGDVGYRVVGMGDFNRDGKEDILFQHTDGTLAVWYMNGTSLASASYLDPRNTGDKNWRVVCAGDLNADGKPDLILQHTDGSPAVWYMDGIKLNSGALFSPRSPGDARWRVVGLGDFNADNRQDLVFQHDDGTLAVWFLNGATLTQSSLFSATSPGAGWRAVGVADRNQDGKPDLLFQHTNSDLAVWFMDGTRFASGVYLNPKNSGGTWKVTGPK